MTKDRQRQWFIDRIAYLQKLQDAADRRGDHAASRRLQRQIEANSTLME